jgi:hypothetical protein
MTSYIFQLSFSFIITHLFCCFCALIRRFSDILLSFVDMEVFPFLKTTILFYDQYGHEKLMGLFTYIIIKNVFFYVNRTVRRLNDTVRIRTVLPP